MTSAIIAVEAAPVHILADYEGSDMDPNKIDVSDAQRIAFATSGGDGKNRWTDLAVYYLPERFGRRRWLSEAVGMSSLAGEIPRRRVLHVGTLDRALKLFEDSDLGRIVIEEALEWREERAEASPAAQVPQNDEEALVALYGAPDPGKRGYTSMLAEDFGVQESTMRAAIKNGTGIRLPLLAVLPYLDVDRFRADRAKKREGGK